MKRLAPPCALIAVAAILFVIFAMPTIRPARPRGWLRRREKTESPYKQQQDIVFADIDGIGLLMDIFTPTGKSNGLAIIDVASGAWYSDRGKINDHKRAACSTPSAARLHRVRRAAGLAQSFHGVRDAEQSEDRAFAG